MFDKSTTCCFSGHRPEKIANGKAESSAEMTALKDTLRIAILKAVHSGYSSFICGMSRGFDLWAAEEILSLRNAHAIKLICAIPFEGQDKQWHDSWRQRYHHVLTHADYVFCLAKSYSPDCFHIRNRFMADHSSSLICYFDGTPGGTEYTVNYSRKSGLDIINLADSQLSLFDI